MNREIIKKRIRAIRRRLNKKKINCLIVTKPANVTYTTGFSGDYSWAVITLGNVYLLTDSRYIEQAKNDCPDCRIIQRADSLTAAVAKLVKKLKSVDVVTVEKSISLTALAELKKQLTTRVKSVADIIEHFRNIKDATEITAITTAARIAAQALKQTLRYLKPKITENELAGRLDFQIRKLTARNSFETIVAFGPNASRPHHQPGSRKLKKNDTVLIDFGVRYKNYCCDLTRCLTVGKATAFYKKAYEAVYQAQTTAIKMVKPGAKISEVDAAARKVITEHNLPVYGHGTGHGLGLEVHEQPVVSAENKGKLKPAMVFTIEPGVYIPGKLGIRIEDDVLVTETGCKILTQPQIGGGLTRNRPHSPRASIDKISTNPQHRPFLKNYHTSM